MRTLVGIARVVLLAGGAGIAGDGCGRSAGASGREAGAPPDVAISSGGVVGTDVVVGSGGLVGAGGLATLGGHDGPVAGHATGTTPASTGAGGSAGSDGAGGEVGGTAESLGLDAAVPDAPGNGGGLGAGGTVGLGGTTGADVATGVDGTLGAGGTTATGGTGGTLSACPTGPALSNGTSHCDGNASGTYGSYQWLFWENGSGGCLITYDRGDAAFSATWNNSGDLLARVGWTWNEGKAYDQLGTITAQFAETRTGTDGGYSYVGVRGISQSPCVEWYIVEDSFNTMPINPGAVSSVGTATIDGGDYIIYASVMTGTGPSLCSGISNWTELYSVRKTARQCGQISITDHFNAWRKVGLALGAITEIMLGTEALGGSGRVDFTSASMIMAQ